jgi:peptidyl-prolyl cis-trans isomerase C
MKKIFIAVMLSIFYFGSSYAYAKDNYIELAKVNQQIITTKIFGKKSEQFKKLSEREKKSLIEKVVIDEILTQYLLKDSNILKISDSKERINKALKKIRTIAVKELNGTITEDITKKYYDDNKKKFWHKSMTIASHILLKDKSKAETVIKKLKDSQDFNTTFRNIATKDSIDSKTNNNYGIIGLFPNHVMVKPFQEAIAKLSKNEYTQKPIKTRFGYHVIWLHDKFKEGYYDYEIVKKSIRFTLLQEEIKKWVIKKAEEGKKVSDVKILYK